MPSLCLCLVAAAAAAAASASAKNTAIATISCSIYVCVAETIYMQVIICSHSVIIACTTPVHFEFSPNADVINIHIPQSQ